MRKAFRLILTTMVVGVSSGAFGASLLDEQMKEVADFFAGTIRGDHEVLLPDALDRTKLDLSVESLRAVDSWLITLAAAGVDPFSDDAAETMVWTGAYVGEVIRACSNGRYTWKRHVEHMATQPESVRQLIPYSFGTQFLLVDGAGKVTLPLNKVVRVLADGPENNLHYYASGECEAK